MDTEKATYALTFGTLYKGKIKKYMDTKYAPFSKWIVGELQTKMANGNLVPFLHFYVTVTNQYIPFDQLQQHIDDGEEIFEKTIEVDASTLCRCTGKKDISNAWVFENDIIESHAGTNILWPDMVIKYGTYQAFCPHDQCYVSTVGFYATGDSLPDMPIGDVQDYAKVIGNLHDK